MHAFSAVRRVDGPSGATLFLHDLSQGSKQKANMGNGAPNQKPSLVDAAADFLSWPFQFLYHTRNGKRSPK